MANCSDWEEVLASLVYRGHGEVSTTFPWWKNDMNHIRWVAVEGRGWALHPEHKGSAWMKDVTQKFTLCR